MTGPPKQPRSLSRNFHDDTLSGGTGADVFVGDSTQLAGDTILDFEVDDTLIIRGADLSSLDGADNGDIDLGGGTLAISGDAFRVSADFDGTDTTIRRDLTGVGGSWAENLYGDGDGNYVNGAGGNDFVNGRGGSDTLSGGDGDDTIHADDWGQASVAGDDYVEGNDGNDQLFGREGNDTLDGGNDHDFLRGWDGDDSLIGGAGSDTMDGGAGADTFAGTEAELADDVIRDFRAGDTLIIRGADYSALDGEAAGDIAIGRKTLSISGDTGRFEASFDGTDTTIRIDDTAAQGNPWAENLYGESGGDLVDGGGGNDFVNGRGGSDTLSGGDGDDTIHADDWGQASVAGDDYAEGNGGNDFLYGREGNDTLDGGADDDSLRGWDGNDSLIGGSGNDTLDGLADDDVLFGGTGDDLLQGGSGNDSLSGGDGVDELFGNDGADTLSGGEGNDVFYHRTGDGDDVIEDFTSGEDLIDIDDSLGVVTQTDLDGIKSNDTDGNAVLDLGVGDSLTLVGVDHSDLTIGDVI